MLRHPILRFLILAGICWVAIAPFLKWGIPSGHDFEFHMYSWMEVVNQWKQGVVYPKWAELAHWGYGEARFIFYPPGSWTLGAVLGAILPWKMVPAAYCWIVLTATGIGMYALARQWLEPPDALFAATFYALNPYHLLIAYWRSAYAELLAAVIVPLMLFCMLRLREEGFRPTLWLSLTLAGAWLTNDPAALMIYYSAAGLAVVMAVQERSVRPLLRTAVAMVLGAGLASFYLLPAIYEQPWVSIAQVLSPGVRPQDNFLFTTNADPDHNRFNLLVSWLAVAEIVALALAIRYSRPDRLNKERSGETQFDDARFEKSAWTLAAAWGAVAAFTMLPASKLLWELLPKFRFVQLPFRWLLCLNASLAILLAMATRRSSVAESSPHSAGTHSASPPRFAFRRSAIGRWMARGMVSAILLLVLLLVGHRIQPPWWDTSGDIAEMEDAISDELGYDGTDEYVPTGADPSEVKKDLPRVSDMGGPAVGVQMLEWDATEKHFVAHTDRTQKLTVRLFNYPAWKVVVNGKPTATQTTDVTGLMVIPVAAGQNDVHIYFARTADRLVGGIVSLISVIVFGLAWIMTGPKPRSPIVTRNFTRAGGLMHTVLVATSNAGKLRDFAGAAEAHGVTIAGIPGFASLPAVVEDGATFEANARKKAEEYSRAAPGELVLADDSGLEIDALGGAPGVHSARYAAGLQNDDIHNKEPHKADANTDDEANNARVLRELAGVPQEKRTARFICVLAAARDGRTLGTFRGSG